MNQNGPPGEFLSTRRRDSLSEALLRVNYLARPFELTFSHSCSGYYCLTICIVTKYLAGLLLLTSLKCIFKFSLDNERIRSQPSTRYKRSDSHRCLGPQARDRKPLCH